MRVTSNIPLGILAVLTIVSVLATAYQTFYLHNFEILAWDDDLEDYITLEEYLGLEE